MNSTSSQTFNKLLRFAMVLFALVIFSVSSSRAASDQPNLVPDRSKIEPALLADLATTSQVDFIVIFAEQADLSPAYTLGWVERGEFVYNTLNEVAQKSQANAKAYLDGQGFTHQTYIASNTMYVWGGNQIAADNLSSFPEVAYIRATRVYSLDPVSQQPLLFSDYHWVGDLVANGVIYTVPAPQQNQPLATVDWGITDTKADQFWTTFGVKGDGIVVANIDTGVQWNHPALVNQFKCPGNPSDPKCWKDPANICGAGGACDNNDHGTHTMGTMLAADNPSLTYIAGMAPNAKWIACKGCEGNNCSDSSLSACGDWLLAPGGSTSNRPNVVNNSWGGGGGDNWYLSTVNSWRAAGIFPAFSAGNSGSGCNTMGSPGDYQESFASAAHSSSRTIASFSSRGPSAFGHTPYTKPNLSAPGVNICSTVPTNGWDCSFSGTSMASPHTAGAVALLWSCNPALVGQIDQTFQLLQNSVDAPPVGNCSAPPDGQGNYTYGYGYLNVLKAGQQTCATVAKGYLNGHVTDKISGNPISGATVNAVLGSSISTAIEQITPQALTDPTGYYTMTLAPGTYSVTASKTDYFSQTVTGVHVLTDTITTQNFQLATTSGPTIVVDAPTLSASLYPANTTSININISNTGNADLIWNFVEVATGYTQAVPQDTVKWVTENPAAGTIAPGVKKVVTITFLSGDLIPGDYHANLEIHSNDAAKPVVTLPVTLTVTSYGVIVVPHISTRFGLPSQTIVYDITITNVSALLGFFNFSITGADWSTILSDTSKLIPMGTSFTLTVTVTVPTAALPGALDAITFTVTNGFGSTDQAQLTSISSQGAVFLPIFLR